MRTANNTATPNHNCLGARDHWESGVMYTTSCLETMAMPTDWRDRYTSVENLEVLLVLLAYTVSSIEIRVPFN